MVLGCDGLLKKFSSLYRHIVSIQSKHTFALTHFSQARRSDAAGLSQSQPTAMMTPGLRNILVLSVSFLLIFTGFHTIALLQDVDGGVSSPPNSLAIIYVVFGITCSSAPCLLSLLGHR